MLTDPSLRTTALGSSTLLKELILLKWSLVSTKLLRFISASVGTSHCLPQRIQMHCLFLKLYLQINKGMGTNCKVPSKL